MWFDIERQGIKTAAPDLLSIDGLMRMAGALSETAPRAQCASVFCPECRFTHPPSASALRPLWPIPAAVAFSRKRMVARRLTHAIVRRVGPSYRAAVGRDSVAPYGEAICSTLWRGFG
jgi:hypothetical protein